MTEKQFMIGDDIECPVIEGKFELNREEVVDLLNKQDEYLNILREELELVDKQNTKLKKKNEQLKSILFDVVERLEMKIYSNEDALYAITLVVDGAMYLRIKEVIE